MERHLAKVEALEVAPEDIWYKEQLIARRLLAERKWLDEHAAFWPAQPGRKVVWPPEDPGPYAPPEEWEDHLKLLQEAEFANDWLKEMLVEQAKERIAGNKKLYEKWGRRTAAKD